MGTITKILRHTQQALSSHWFSSPAPEAKPAAYPENESERLKALARYQILDTLPEEAFDDLTVLAASICNTPIALVSLVDEKRQWFKSKFGLDATETPREMAFCSHAILTPSEPLIVPNALDDERFATNPLVLSGPKIRFYAGVPLVTPDNFPIGTLCTIDRVPRQLTSQHIAALEALGRQVVAQLELRLNLTKLEQTVIRQKHTEEALLNSLATNRALLNAIPDSIFRINRDRVFINYKAPKESQIFLNEADFIGKKVEEIFPAFIAQSWCDRIEQARKTGELQILEYQWSNEGKEAYWEARLAVSESDEIVAIIRDITERKQAEDDLQESLHKEKELSELKSRFISTASHEFRTPLTAILGSTELLRYYSHNWSEEKKQLHFERIHSRVQHMTQLLDDVLLVGKAEAQKMEFQPSSINLIQFCHSLVEELQLSTARNHSIVFASPGLDGAQENEALSNPYTSAVLDEKLLQHILSNLLSNAIKYSPVGSTIQFLLTCHEHQAIFQIQDRGIGIPDEDQLRLFEAFHRATNVGDIPGTGLGLVIIKNAVDLHGGKITVNSQVGVGTTFTVTLPLK
ncbi:MAG TPA: ATP-binding protein [Coleofasciculaceae cyanobacterium]